MSAATLAALAGVVALILVALWQSRRARAALVERERRLAQAQRMEMVGRLAGGLAHDVNNYLATIRAHSEIVARRELPREQVVAKMELIAANVVKASALLERLLTFARRQPVCPELVNLNEVIEAFLAMGRGAERAGVAVAVRLSESLPPVEIDLAEIEQVLANLFVNACDALPGAGTVTISTAAMAGASGGAEVELAVADTGRGIAPEDLPRIFEPFFSTKAGQGATGLGLATVRSIVSEAGGRVEVESEPGRGTTFRVRLPARSAAPSPTAAPRHSASAAAARGKGERILLVDDNRDLAAGVAAELEALGYAVTAVASAAEAEAAVAASSSPFDLIVTDVLLEGLPGTALVDRLRERGPLPALYMSGFTDRIALRRGPGAAEAYFLKKPFSAEGLARMVRELLDAPAAGQSATPARASAAD